jgi:hypothetical protein
MEEIGQPRAALVAAAAILVAAFGCVWAWPFAIDDAWISVRYARHVAGGAGYVWNVGGPRTDGVTPLPWAFMLVPLAKAAPVVVLTRVKLAGALVWMATACAWGGALGRVRAPLWAKVAAVVLLAIDVPVAAHAVSGMETVFAMALATLAVLLRGRPWIAAAFAGLAGTLRPELVVWAAVVSVGFALALDARAHARALSVGGLAILPFVVCAVVRGAVFGRVAPLSVLAKPSDLAHGFVYAGAAAVFSLGPIVLWSPIALSRERGPALAVALAALAHVAVIVAVGGDWMPYARLMVPIVPGMLFAFVLVSPHAAAPWSAIRVAVAVALGLYLLPSSVRALRQAGEDRAAMIISAAPLLESSKRIATVDIGWVSAVSEAGIIDLAGVTDPDVAVKGGGHTSKRIDAAFLLAHDPDAVLFYSDSLPDALGDVSAASFPRVVEARLARSDLFAEKFEPAAFIPLGTRGTGYVLFKKRR